MKKTEPKVVRLNQYGSAYKISPAGFLLFAPILLSGKIEESWNLVELSAIEGELDVKKFKGELKKKLGKFVIAS